MENFYTDERISSYLDGELSADEQARFEERLAESAELRQLVEELRALRGSLDLLPRYQLEPNFAERVLRRAEQQMLTGGEGGSSGGDLAASDDGESSMRSAQPSHPILDESRRWQRRIVRPLVYAGAAIAAAILIMVFTPPGGNEVAQNRKVEDQARRGEGGFVTASKSQDKVAARSLESAKKPAQDQPAFDQPAADHTAIQSNAPAKDGKPFGGVANEPVEGAGRSTSLGSTNGTQAGRSPASSNGSLAVTPSGAANMPADRDPLQQSASASPKADESGIAARVDELSVGRRANGGQGGGQFSKDESPATRPNVEGSAAKRNLASNGPSDQGRHYSDATDLAKATELLRRGGYGNRPADLLVASYEVNPNTTNSAFFGLLAKHRIEIRPATEGAPSDGSRFTARVARDASAPTEAFLEQGQRTWGDENVANGRPSGTQQRRAMRAAAEPRRDLEIVYVEGSSQQITDLVSDLDANKTEFRSIAVDPNTITKLSVGGQAGNGAAAPGPLPNANVYSFHPEERAAPVTANAARRDDKNTDSIAKSGAGKNLHELSEKQKELETKEAASQAGKKAQAADKNPALVPDTSVSKGGEAETLKQPAPAGFGVAKPSSDDQNKALQYYSKSTGEPSHGAKKTDSADLKTPKAGDEPLDLPTEVRSRAEPKNTENKPAAAANLSLPQSAPRTSALGTIAPDSRGVPPGPPAAGAAASPQKPAAVSVTRDGDNYAGDGGRLDLNANLFRPSQADRGKEEEGEPPGYAFWLYPLPTEVKQGLINEQLDPKKQQKEQLQDAPAPSTDAGLALSPKSAAPASSAPRSAHDATPMTPATTAGPTLPSAIENAPKYKAANRPKEPSPPNSAKQPAAESYVEGRSAIGQPAAEKPSESGDTAAKLRAKGNDDPAVPAALPPTPPPPAQQDFERSFKRDASRRGAQIDARPDAKDSGTATPSPRMQAILIFRVSPAPATAAPPPIAGPAAAEKGK